MSFGLTSTQYSPKFVIDPHAPVISRFPRDRLTSGNLLPSLTHPLYRSPACLCTAQSGRLHQFIILESILLLFFFSFITIIIRGEINSCPFIARFVPDFEDKSLLCSCTPKSDSVRMVGFGWTRIPFLRGQQLAWEFVTMDTRSPLYFWVTDWLADWLAE